MGSTLALSSGGTRNTLFSMVLNLFSSMLEGSLGISASSEEEHPPIAVIIINIIEDRDHHVTACERAA